MNFYADFMNLYANVTNSVQKAMNSGTKQYEFKAIQEQPSCTLIKQYPRSNTYLEFRVGEAADTEEKR